MSAVSPQEIIDLSNRLFATAFDATLPDATRMAAFRAHQEVRDAAFAAALSKFRSGTKALLRLSADLAEAVAGLGVAGAGPLPQLLDDIGRLHARLHDDEGMRTTWSTSEEFEASFSDEQEIVPDVPSMPLPPPPVGLTALTQVQPINSRSFADLEDEYLLFFAGQGWKSEAAHKDALDLARQAVRNQARYEAVGAQEGVPWWFIAATHLLESSYNFTTHLHNGDSLSKRTFRVPAGRPKTGQPPFTWEASVADALRSEGLSGLMNWSLARALYRWEAYNGFGYRSRGVPSPYLWSMSTIYNRGKFVGDGVFSATAVSSQCGAAALLRALMELAAAGVSPTAELRGEGPGDELDSENADAAGVIEQGLPNIDGVVSTNADFRDFFAANLPEIQDFEWHEFIVKGSGHRVSHLNTDPPRELWPNVVPLVRVLEAIRKEIGHSVVLTSVYRSPEYNASLPGAAKASQHMQFRAADFKVPGHGTAADWHAAALHVRDQLKLFSGGIGRYNSFVHVDTRGVNKNW